MVCRLAGSWLGAAPKEETRAGAAKKGGRRGWCCARSETLEEESQKDLALALEHSCWLRQVTKIRPSANELLRHIWEAVGR